MAGGGGILQRRRPTLLRHLCGRAQPAPLVLRLWVLQGPAQRVGWRRRRPQFRRGRRPQALRALSREPELHAHLPLREAGEDPAFHPRHAALPPAARARPYHPLQLREPPLVHVCPLRLHAHGRPLRVPVPPGVHQRRQPDNGASPVVQHELRHRLQGTVDHVRDHLQRRLAYLGAAAHRGRLAVVRRLLRAVCRRRGLRGHPYHHGTLPEGDAGRRGHRRRDDDAAEAQGDGGVRDEDGAGLHSRRLVHGRHGLVGGILRAHG
mmetsp:Transcript_29060/g.73817  ORF Transcript_29060/g.73817 Transcript_29060/m.73817 type:complete len:264 (+) Transcript_29060:617-1408(+)